MTEIKDLVSKLPIGEEKRAKDLRRQKQHEEDIAFLSGDLSGVPKRDITKALKRATSYMLKIKAGRPPKTSKREFRQETPRKECGDAFLEYKPQVFDGREPVLSRSEFSKLIKEKKLC